MIVQEVTVETPMVRKLDVMSRFIKPLYDVKIPSFGNLAGRDLFATSSGDGGEVSPTRKLSFLSTF